jgi:hypothetical protein
MTSAPRLALALLNRFTPDDEPLTGDLLEEYAAGRSRAWFWRQTIAAVALTMLRRSDEVRPLRLVDGVPARVSPLASAATIAPRRTVNLTASPIAGIGGLSLVIMGTLVTIVMPQAWWLVAAAALAGVIFGVVLIAIRRSRV